MVFKLPLIRRMCLCVHAHTWSLLHKHRGPYQTAEQKCHNPHKRRAAFFSYKYVLRWSPQVRRMQGLSYLPSPIFNTHLLARRDANSRLNLQWVEAVAQSIARAWLFLPAFHTCSRDAFLQGFWSSLPLAVPSNEWHSQRNTESLDVPLCCLHDRHFSMQFACTGWPGLRGHAGEYEQPGWPRSALVCISFTLALLKPGLEATQEEALALQPHS